MSDERKLYVGNLSYKTEEKDLEVHFEKYGTILKCAVIRDRETEASRGFGFVTFENLEDGKAAIDGLDGTSLDGRTIRVSVATNRGEGGGGGHGGGGYHGGGGGGNGYQSGGYRRDGSRSGGYQSGGPRSGGYQSGGYQSGGYQSGGYQSGGYQSGGYQSGGSGGGSGGYAGQD
ncbi:uncharacterized protein [Clinocottus analis]|uniref:uncharacterized protein n=1 Tax=Clinocottus analis TaxID=304258 RepID=UPI0035C079DC